MIMLADNILIDPKRWPIRKQGVIHIPDMVKQKFSLGIVQGVGPGTFTINGVQMSPAVAVGDRVLYHSGMGIPIVVDEREMLIVMEREVIAILEPGDFDDIETPPEGPDEAEEINDATSD